jgi:replication factor C subunit 2/4
LFQVIPAATIDGIFTACHSGSFDKLEAVVKVIYSYTTDWVVPALNKAEARAICNKNYSGYDRNHRLATFLILNFLLQNLIDEGHAATQLVNQLHDAIIENENLSDKHKSIITEKLAVSCKHYTSTTTNFFWYVLVIFLFPFVGSRQVLGRWCR